MWHTVCLETVGREEKELQEDGQQNDQVLYWSYSGWLQAYGLSYDHASAMKMQTCTELMSVTSVAEATSLC